MRVRVTIMTENDAHIDDLITDSQIKLLVHSGWNSIIQKFIIPNNPNPDKAYVEKVEVVER